MEWHAHRPEHPEAGPERLSDGHGGASHELRPFRRGPAHPGRCARRFMASSSGREGGLGGGVERAEYAKSLEADNGGRERGDRRPALALGLEAGEVVVADDLVAVVGQALVERPLGHQLPPHHPSLEEEPWGSTRPTEYTDLRGSGELRAVIFPNRPAGREYPDRPSARSRRGR